MESCLEEAAIRSIMLRLHLSHRLRSYGIEHEDEGRPISDWVISNLGSHTECARVIVCVEVCSDRYGFLPEDRPNRDGMTY